MKSKLIPVFLAFLCMGFLDAVGPFVGLAKETFQLSYTLAQLLPFVGFILFFVLSVPTSLLQDKKGKKFTLLLGLSIAFIGVFISTLSRLSSFSLLLATIFLLGAGATIMQVAGNPIMRDVSEPGKYSRNLSLAQFVKAIGSLSGPVLPVLAAKWWGGDWKDVFPIYCAFLFLAIVANVQLKVNAPVGSRSIATFRACLALLKDPFVRRMVLGIFLYVGSEVCVSSGIPLLFKSKYHLDIAKIGILGTGIFFLALTVGRFLGGMILNWVKPKPFLLATGILSLLGLLGFIMGIQMLSLVSAFIIGLGFANIFPLIFSITIDTMPEKSNALSGLMVMAIVGGAFLPPIMGVVADYASMTTGFLVPMGGILYVTLSAITILKKS